MKQNSSFTRQTSIMMLCNSKFRHGPKDLAVLKPVIPSTALSVSRHLTTFYHANLFHLKVPTDTTLARQKASPRRSSSTSPTTSPFHPQKNANTASARTPSRSSRGVAGQFRMSHASLPCNPANTIELKPTVRDPLGRYRRRQHQVSDEDVAPQP